jgi:catechol 2,3-dioxygenase-like lactoylglutathione lyase family enzyme
MTLAVRNMAECVPFYQSLGLTLIVDSAPRYVRFEMSSGDTLSLHHADDWQGGDWPLVYLEIDELDAFCDRLESQGLALETQPETKAYLWREADLRDPSGNLIRLYHAGENRLNPPWRLDAAE